MIDDGLVSARTVMLRCGRMRERRCPGCGKVSSSSSAGNPRRDHRRRVVAPIASELILPIALAVQNRITVDQLAQTLAVYPSLSGSITEAARR